jgi:hypothetical protein
MWLAQVFTSLLPQYMTLSVIILADMSSGMFIVWLWQFITEVLYSYIVATYIFLVVNFLCINEYIVHISEN